LDFLSLAASFLRMNDFLLWLTITVNLSKSLSDALLALVASFFPHADCSNLATVPSLARALMRVPVRAPLDTPLTLKSVSERRASG
jgi:hypothetical protein